MKRIQRSIVVVVVVVILSCKNISNNLWFFLKNVSSSPRDGRKKVEWNFFFLYWNSGQFHPFLLALISLKWKPQNTFNASIIRRNMLKALGALVGNWSIYRNHALVFEFLKGKLVLNRKLIKYFVKFQKQIILKIPKWPKLCEISKTNLSKNAKIRKKVKNCKFLVTNPKNWKKWQIFTRFFVQFPLTSTSHHFCLFQTTLISLPYL